LNGGGQGDPAAHRRRARGAVVGGAAALVLALDQITKALAVSRLPFGPVELVGPLRLELVYNSGVAFSLLSGLTVPIVLVVVALIALLTRFARSVPSFPAAAGIGMVIGGALGNLVDRLLRAHGQVVDFIYTGFWPTFNLADASIVCGGAVVAVALWRAGRAHDLAIVAARPTPPAGPLAIDDAVVSEVGDAARGQPHPAGARATSAQSPPA
jgi:signal peptidase II